MSTPATIINQALENLGVIRPAETISPDLLASCFLALQQRWDLMSLDQLFTYAWYHQQFAMTAGTSAYTVGLAGTLTATADPIRIVGWRSQSGNFSNAGTPISFEQFEANVKDPLSTTSVLAQVVAVDGQVPTKNIRVFPVPATSPGAMILDYFGKMVALATTGQTLSFGPGYEDFMHNDLAVLLYPRYARQGALSLQALNANRENALNLIRGLNASIQGLGQGQPQAAA